MGGKHQDDTGVLVTAGRCHGGCVLIYSWQWCGDESMATRLMEHWRGIWFWQSCSLKESNELMIPENNFELCSADAFLCQLKAAVKVCDNMFFRTKQFIWHCVLRNYVYAQSIFIEPPLLILYIKRDLQGFFSVLFYWFRDSHYN